jgi:hypothetical protein
VQQVLLTEKTYLLIYIFPPNTDFTRELMYLARKGNDDVLNLFESCFDNIDHVATGESFDASFFLENVMEIVQESIEKKKNKCD